MPGATAHRAQQWAEQVAADQPSGIGRRRPDELARDPGRHCPPRRGMGLSLGFLPALALAHPRPDLHNQSERVAQRR